MKVNSVYFAEYHLQSCLALSCPFFFGVIFILFFSIHPHSPGYGTLSQRHTAPPAVSGTNCTLSHLCVFTLHTSADTGWKHDGGGGVEGVGVAWEARVGGAEATDSGSQVSWFLSHKVPTLHFLCDCSCGI